MKNNVTIEIDPKEDGKTQTNIDKIKTLQSLLESWTIDEDKTLIGCEPVYKNTFNESEVYTLKSKLFNLIEEL